MKIVRKVCFKEYPENNAYYARSIVYDFINGKGIKNLEIFKDIIGAEFRAIISDLQKNNSDNTVALKLMSSFIPFMI
jgi:hypothetical protein